MKKLAINLVLLALAGFFSYYLYKSIERPLHFKNEWAAREQVVREQLKDIAELQKMYKGLKKGLAFAPNFDTLELALLNDTFFVEKVMGDPGNENAKPEVKIIAIPAKDSLIAFMKKKGKTQDPQTYLKEIRVVPFSNGKATFEMRADSSVTKAADGNSASIPTFEVVTRLGAYMPEFDSSYMIYQRYYPDSIRKIGDLTKPSTSGNW